MSSSSYSRASPSSTSASNTNVNANVNTNANSSSTSETGPSSVMELRKTLSKKSYATRENAKLCDAAVTMLERYIEERRHGNLAQSVEFLGLLELFLFRTFGDGHSPFYMQGSTWIIASARGGNWPTREYSTNAMMTKEAMRLVQFLERVVFPLLQRSFIHSAISTNPRSTLFSDPGSFQAEDSFSFGLSSPSASFQAPLRSETTRGLGLEEFPKKSQFLLMCWGGTSTAERERWLRYGAVTDNAARLYGLSSHSDEPLTHGSCLRGRLQRSSQSVDLDTLSFLFTTIIAHAVRVNRRGGASAGTSSHRRPMYRMDEGPGGANDPWLLFVGSYFESGAQYGLVHSLVSQNSPYNTILSDFARALVCSNHPDTSRGGPDLDSDIDGAGGFGSDEEGLRDEGRAAASGVFDADGGDEYLDNGSRSRLVMHPPARDLLLRLVVEHWLSRCIVTGCGGKEARAREISALRLRRDHNLLTRSHAVSPSTGINGISARMEPASFASDLPVDLTRVLDTFEEPTKMQVDGLLIFSAHLLSDASLLCYNIKVSEDGRSAELDEKHPAGTILKQMAGFLVSCFHHLQPTHSTAMMQQYAENGKGNPTATFVRIIELWMIWMKPWTAKELLQTRRFGQSFIGRTRHRIEISEEQQQAWLLAAEDVYVLPLIPFLSAMSTCTFDGSRRDAQLNAVERALRCFTRPSFTMHTLLSSNSGLARRVLVMPEQLQQLLTMGFAESLSRTELERAWKEEPCEANIFIGTLGSASTESQHQEPTTTTTTTTTVGNAKGNNDVWTGWGALARRNLERAISALEARGSGVGSVSVPVNQRNDDIFTNVIWQEETPEWRARGTEVIDFLRKMHHGVLIGGWLPQNVDYDDILNRILWVIAMICAQASQVLELVVSGTSARFRLHRVAVDLSIIFGVNQSYMKDAFQNNSRKGPVSDSDDPSGFSSFEEAMARQCDLVMRQSFGRANRGLYNEYEEEGELNRRNPWRRPLQSYELLPLVLLSRYISKRIDLLLHVAWQYYCRDRPPNQQPPWWWPRRHLNAQKYPLNLRPMADMRNIGFATIFAAILASSSFRAFAFSWPSLIILCCFVYFLRYPDKWCIFYGQYFQAEGSF